MDLQQTVRATRRALRRGPKVSRKDAAEAMNRAVRLVRVRVPLEALERGYLLRSVVGGMIYFQTLPGEPPMPGLERGPASHPSRHVFDCSRASWSSTAPFTIFVASRSAWFTSFA